MAERGYRSPVTVGRPARVDRDPDATRVRLGCFDAAEGARIVGHVWAGSKAPWFGIDDVLPCELEGPSVLP